MHAESSGKSTGDTWQLKCETTAGVQWVWQLAVTPGDLGFTALEKDRDRSTGFLVWNLRFASGKETFSVTLIFWISLSRRNVGHLLSLAGWSPSQFTQCGGLSQGCLVVNWRSALPANRVYWHTSLLSMPKPLALEAAQRVRHILPHTEVVESGNDPFRERWSVKSKDQGRSRDHFPLLLPSDPVHLSHAIGLKKV